MRPKRGGKLRGRDDVLRSRGWLACESPRRSVRITCRDVHPGRPPPQIASRARWSHRRRFLIRLSPGQEFRPFRFADHSPGQRLWHPILLNHARLRRRNITRKASSLQTRESPPLRDSASTPPVGDHLLDQVAPLAASRIPHARPKNDRPPPQPAALADTWPSAMMRSTRPAALREASKRSRRNRFVRAALHRANSRIALSSHALSSIFRIKFH